MKNELSDGLSDAELIREFQQAMRLELDREILEYTGVPVTTAMLAESEARFNELASDPRILALAI